MCLILISWQQHPDYPLVIAANRDEYYERPSEPAHFWPDAPHLLAGRDSEQGGTWLGITRTGRFAAVTNFRRDASTPRPEALSRGQLTTRFLNGDSTPAQFLEQLEAEKSRYNPFNLLVGDRHQFCLSADDRPGWHTLEAGIHALGNGRLEDDSEKQRRGRVALADAMAHGAEIADLQALLEDTRPSAPAGESAEDRAMSARFIRLPEKGYGTRAATVLRISREGTVEFVEQNHDTHGAIGTPASFSWRLQAPPAPSTDHETPD